MQKAQRLGLMLALLMSFMMVASTAMAQRTSTVGQLLSGLVNVNVNVGDVTLEDLIDVDIVLNNNEIRVLNNALNNNSVLSNIANNLTIDLRNADIITDNQVVVGVLSGGQIVVRDLLPA